MKPADLDKSAPRLHGSMFLEVLALRFLMVFSCFVRYFPCQFSIHFWIDFGGHFDLFLGSLFELLGSKGRQNVIKIQ